MKRKLEEDRHTNKQVTQSPYLASKVKEYHLVFHILCGLIDTLSKDVAFTIGYYYYHLWSTPDNALEAHQVFLSPINGLLSFTPCKAVVIHSAVSETDPFAITMTSLHISFDHKGRYTIEHTITTWERLHRFDDQYRANYIYDRVQRVVKNEGSEVYMTAYVCVDNDVLEKKLESLGHILRANRIVLYKSDPLWRNNTSLMDVIFQYEKPRVQQPFYEEYLMDPVRILLCLMLGYTCHVSLKPYRMCYENDNEQDSSRTLLYLLIVVLNDYKNGSKGRFVSNI